MLVNMKAKIIFFGFLILLISSCETELCRNCNSYNVEEFQGDLNTYYGSFFVCEHDGMWDEIVWWEECNGCVLDNTGGTLSFIDLDIYKVGVRHVPNMDIDGDGILNQYDNDIRNH